MSVSYEVGEVGWAEGRGTRAVRQDIRSYHSMAQNIDIVCPHLTHECEETADNVSTSSSTAVEGNEATRNV